VELVLLIVIALAFIAKPFAGGDEKPVSGAKATAQTEAAGKGAAAEEAARVDPVFAKIPRAQTAVLVLNGNGVAGAANNVAKRVRTLDYPVSGIGDAARRDFPKTIVMYRPGFEGEAQRLARDLRLELRRAVPLDGMRPAELGSAKLAVIVGG
jgi:hypothetical protein